MSRTGRRAHGGAEDWSAPDQSGRHYIDVYGTDGRDTLVGTDADERFHPMLGDDDVSGGGGDDALTADYSDQRAIGPYSSSIYNDGAGQYNGSLSCAGSLVFFDHITRVYFHETGGDDYVNVAPTGVSDSLIVDGGAGNDELFLLEDGLTADTIIIHHHGPLDFMGGHFKHFEDFTIRLASGNDYIEFGKGDDPLVGNGGDDVLKGGGGDDYLLGGPGADLLIGGHGADTLAFQNIADFTNGDKLDEIKHFSRAQGDKIEFMYIDADPATPGDQAFSIIGTAPFTGRSGPYELRFEHDGHGKLLLQIDVNHDRIADYQMIVHATDLLPGDIVA